MANNKVNYIHVHCTCTCVYVYVMSLMMNNLLNTVFDTCVCLEAWAKLTQQWLVCALLGTHLHYSRAN